MYCSRLATIMRLIRKIKGTPQFASREGTLLSKLVTS